MHFRSYSLNILDLHIFISRRAWHFSCIYPILKRAVIPCCNGSSPYAYRIWTRSCVGLMGLIRMRCWHVSGMNWCFHCGNAAEPCVTFCFTNHCSRCENVERSWILSSVSTVASVCSTISLSPATCQLCLHGSLNGLTWPFLPACYNKASEGQLHQSWISFLWQL